MNERCPRCGENAIAIYTLLYLPESKNISMMDF